MLSGRSRPLPAAPRMSQAVLFFTHDPHPRILGHYRRLQAEAGEIVAVRLGIDGRAPAMQGIDLGADVVLNGADSDRLFPGRFTPPLSPYERICESDLVRCALLLSPQLGAFEHLWLMEYDVDYAGSWRDFFAATASIPHDVLGTRIRRRADEPGWVHWQFLACPEEVAEEDRIMGFFPMMRLSRRFLETFKATLQDRAWRGHFEALVPMIASHNGLTVGDLGHGPFGDPARRPLCNPSSFRLRRSRSRYFHEAPNEFRVAGQLYHPIKLGARPKGFSRSALSMRFENAARRLRGIINPRAVH